MYTLLVIVLTAGIVAGLSYIYKDKIINAFVDEANKYINTEVSVGKIELSVFEKFPEVSIKLKNLKIAEPGKKNVYFAEAEAVFLSFDVLLLLKEVYELENIHVENGKVTLIDYADGTNNYDFIKKDSTQKSENFGFNLQKISINNVAYTYRNEKNNQEYKGVLSESQNSLAQFGEKTLLKANSSIAIEDIRLGSSSYFSKKKVKLTSEIVIHSENGIYTIKPSEIIVGSAVYNVEGTVTTLPVTLIDLKLKGKNTTFQNLLSLLPGKIAEPFKPYKSDGEIYFNGTIKGEASTHISPEIRFSFGCKNARFYHPDYNKKLENIHLKGYFTNGSKRNNSTSKINLSNITAQLDGRPLKANFTYGNFDDPTLELDFESKALLASVFTFVPKHPFSDIKGEADIQFNFKGKMNDFKKELSDKNFDFFMAGEITVYGFGFRLKDNDLEFKDFGGNFIFNKNDVAATLFSGRIGKSDFMVDGSFSNIIPYLLFENQKITIDANMKSSMIDLDELLKDQKESGTATDSEYHFFVSPNIDANVSCTFKQVRFRKFRAKYLYGGLRVKDRILTTDAISFDGMGGKVLLKATVNNTDKNFVDVVNTTTLENIYIDSLFYVMEDFGQEFLTQKNIKGIINTSIESKFRLNSQLELDSKSLVSDVDMSITKGELIDFAPMQSMSKFIESSELADIKFSEIKHNIHIENRTIYIPKMDIKSSVADIAVFGSHTFDNYMDYRVKVPLSAVKRKKDKDQEFGTVIDDGNKAFVHLKIVGNASDFKVSYDTRETKQNIKESIKKEKQEFKNLFKNPEKLKKKESDTQLNEEEYFDF